MPYIISCIYIISFCYSSPLLEKQPHQLNKRKGSIDHGYETRNFVPMSLMSIGPSASTRNWGFAWISTTRQRGLPGDTVHSSRFGGVDHFRQGDHFRPAGLVDPPVLAVYDIDVARDDLIARGVDVSEVFHYAGGPFNNAVENPRVGGRDPQGRSYYSFASFEDPDGNGWLLQEMQTRFPGPSGT